MPFKPASHISSPAIQSASKGGSDPPAPSKQATVSCSSTSSILTTPRFPPPSTPPSRPPRPKTSLPNLRPTIILSPLAIPARVSRLQTPVHSTEPYRFSDEVFASLPEYLKVDSEVCKVIKPSPNDGHGHKSSPSPSPLSSSLTMQSSQIFDRAFLPGRNSLSTRGEPASTSTSWTPSVPSWDEPSASPFPSFSKHECNPHPRCHLQFLSSADTPKGYTCGSEMEIVVSHDPYSCPSPYPNHDDPALFPLWPLRLLPYRRLLCMLGTVLFVIVSVTAIAGGVIWKLTTRKFSSPFSAPCDSSIPFSSSLVPRFGNWLVPTETGAYCRNGHGN